MTNVHAHALTIVGMEDEKGVYLVGSRGQPLVLRTYLVALMLFLYIVWLLSSQTIVSESHILPTPSPRY